MKHEQCSEQIVRRVAPTLRDNDSQTRTFADLREANFCHAVEREMRDHRAELRCEPFDYIKAQRYCL
jgi:hypothetical protein